MREPGARCARLAEIVGQLGVSVVAIQEAEESLVRQFRGSDTWRTLWTPKERNKPDGCLTLVDPDLPAPSTETFVYPDGSGHIAQILALQDIVIVNSHLKWAPADSPDHIGVRQAHELVSWLSAFGGLPAAILADCNDRPDGPVRRVFTEHGFSDQVGTMETAYVDGEGVSIDIIATRGLYNVRIVPTHFQPGKPCRDLPSDHVPVVAELL